MSKFPTTAFVVCCALAIGYFNKPTPEEAVKREAVALEQKQKIETERAKAAVDRLKKPPKPEDDPCWPKYGTTCESLNAFVYAIGQTRQ